MINYKKRITLQKMSGNIWFLDTDKGDRYETVPVIGSHTPWTQWWEKQDPSDLRTWQKDILKDFGSKWRDLTPYVVYKKGAGYSQPHDIALARSDSNQVWILSTERDFWFVSSDYGQVDFVVEDSMGSVLEQGNRFEMGKLRDALPYD